MPAVAKCSENTSRTSPSSMLSAYLSLLPHRGFTGPGPYSEAGHLIYSFLWPVVSCNNPSSVIPEGIILHK